MAIALAQRIVLALQLTKLAKKSEQVAIVREQEKAAQERVRELAQANKILKKSLNFLSSELDLTVFVGQILTAIAEQFDMSLAEYWCVKGKRAYICTIWWQGQVYYRESIAQILPSHPGLEGLPVSPETLDYRPSVRPDKYTIDKDFQNHPQVKDEPWSEEWFRVFGPLNTSLGVPLIIKDTLAGMMRVRCQDDGSFTEQQIELAYALGHQVTLAMQLTRLAEEARQTAVLNERNRLAREIHDSLAQTFVSIMMRLQTAQLAIDTQLPEARANLDQALTLARQGLVEARRSVQALRPLALESGNLAQALQQHLAQITEGAAIQGTFAQTGVSKPLPAIAELNLFRIGQEAIANAYSHADAREIRVHLRQAAAQVELSVQDDGRGFSLANLSGVEGFGLANMQQRAQHIQATLSIDSQPQQGTRISVVLVLTAPSAADLTAPSTPASTPPSPQGL